MLNPSRSCEQQGWMLADTALLMLLQVNGLGAMGSWWLLLLPLEVAVAALHICKGFAGNLSTEVSPR